MNPTNSDHVKYLRTALNEAQKSPPQPTNFRVGCVIVSFSPESSPEIISTGYTLELPGNTHAEEVALSKLSNTTTLQTAQNVHLYTTLEPCGQRLSGKSPCVERIISTRSETSEGKGGIKKVIFGAKEPNTFIEDSQACKKLTEAGIEWAFVEGLEKEILDIAMTGHVKPQEEQKGQSDEKAKDENSGNGMEYPTDMKGNKLTEPIKRNPKKRMMEVDVGGSNQIQSQSNSQSS